MKGVKNYDKNKSLSDNCGYNSCIYHWALKDIFLKRYIRMLSLLLQFSLFTPQTVEGKKEKTEKGRDTQ